MASPSALFSGTEDEDNVHVDAESDDEVLLIEEHNFLFSVTALIFRDREGTSSPCLFQLFVYIVLDTLQHMRRIFSAKFLP